ncbi:hypothetical protein PENSOL_c009G02287 [Penicillium solitum]|uniref:Uncharacterized protein n=1 Tax=Penicillium solitum TaxID=60172 RepID=A0A1V6RAG0_9EURO|nr:uncharacterized protein PENSOL_c009G02287 [Penicillium solitum]OQD98399.1 hypothetical protein PENSOL_c009G02287 [Penicillium solitum]
MRHGGTLKPLLRRRRAVKPRSGNGSAHKGPPSNVNPPAPPMRMSTWCYKGMIQIDGNSLYASLMANIGIFIDRMEFGDVVDRHNVEVGFRN